MSSHVLVDASQTRLVTIAAHVDAGKTTLADHLIESNGLISERMAGSIRYLDSLEEEQRRGITIHASAIGLQFYKQDKKYVIHLVDSPGHSDFGNQVKTALMACDAAFLLVDVVEGWSARTHAVMREILAHQLRPILVINKIDRLHDLHMSATEAFLRIRNVLETVNAASASLLAAQTEAMIDSDMWNFDPALGNVVFCSALHGWAFTVPSLARSLFRSQTLPIKPMQLKPVLFGDYKARNSKVFAWKSNSDDVPLFAEFGIQPIWDIYENLAAPNDVLWNLLQHGAAVDHNVPATPNELQALHGEHLVKALLRRYRPLAECLLDVAIDNCPSPVQAATSRSQTLVMQPPTTISPEWTSLQKAIHKCQSDGPTVAQVCAFLTTSTADIRDSAVPRDGNVVLLALTRVLSGRLQTNQSYYCFRDDNNNNKDSKEQPQPNVRLYLIMGSSFVAIDSVPAGHLCAVSNLQTLGWKTLTLSDSPHATALRGLPRIRPIVKVNVEPQDPADMEILEGGLSQLSLADSAVEVTATAKGERLLACLGELHLEQSILELTKLHCSKEIALRISDPIVDFRESTDWFAHETEFETFAVDDKSPPLRQQIVPPYNEEEDVHLATRGRMRSIVTGRVAAIRLRVVPLTSLVYQSLQQQTVVKGSEEHLVRLGRALGMQLDKWEAERVLKELVLCLCSLGGNETALIESQQLWDGFCVKAVVSPLGEVYSVDCSKNNDDEEGMLIAREASESLWREICRSSSPQLNEGKPISRIWADMKGSVVAGFQLATRAGPICEEPNRNIMVVLEGVEIAVNTDSNDELVTTKPISGGMVVSATRRGVRCALLSRPARLMEGILRLTLHSSFSGLGSLYSVISKRRGKVVQDDMVEGTDLLLITAEVPQAEAFGLAPELFGKSSGEVTAPEMAFSHWECLDVDPFWIPTSLEEREDFGEVLKVGDASTGVDNPALRYIRAVRKRKGLVLDSSRTTGAAEKQRTLKR